MRRVRRGLGWLGWTLVGLLLLVALLLTLARQAFPALADYREEIAAALGERLGVSLAIEGLRADWSGRWPRLELTGVRTFTEGEAGPEVRARLARLSLEMDLLQSLLRLAPVFSRAEVEALETVWRERDGAWLHRPAPDEVGGGLSASAWRGILGLIMLQPEVSVRSTKLTLVPENGDPRHLYAPELLLRNSRREHQISGLLDLAAMADSGELRFAVETREVPADPLLADYDFYLKLEGLGPELPNLAGLPLRFEALSLGTELWGRLSGGRPEYLQGHLDVARLETDDPRVPDVLDAGTGFALLRHGDGYQLQLNDLEVGSAGSRFEQAQLVADVEPQAGGWQPRSLSAPLLELAPLRGWLQAQPFTPEPLRRTLETLAPAGRLRNLRLELPPSGDYGDFRLAADLDGLAMEAGWGAPRIRGIGGRLEADRHGGRVHLASDDFELFFPELYDAAWHYDAAGGRVRWTLEPDRVVIGSDLLHLANDSVNAAGRFSLAMPFDREQQTELTLMIGMTDSDALQTGHYVPPDQVGRSLYRWLDDAVRGGRVRRGGLVLHTGTRSLEEGRRPTVQLFFDVDGAEFAYRPGWPSVSDGRAFVLLRDRELLVEVEEGQLLDSGVEHARVYLAGRGAPLLVSGRLAGGAGDVRRVLLESPLREFLGDELTRWQFSGEAATELRLAIPLEGGRQPVVAVGSRLSGGRLQSEAYRLDFSELDGDIFYSSARGLRSEGFGGRFLGEPVSVLIRTPQLDPQRTRIELSGQLPAGELAKWSRVDLLDSLTGRAAYNARLELCARGEGCNRLVVSSDLRGVAVPWPTPLGKAGNEPRPLQVTLELGSGTLRVNYDQRLRAVFGLGEGLRGRLTFGGQRPELPERDGLWLDGHIDSLDGAQVQALLESQGWMGTSAAATPATTDPGPLRELQLSIGRLQLGDRAFDRVELRLLSSPWRLQVGAPQLDGQLTWPQAPGQPYRLQLERLQLPAPGQSGDNAETPPGEPIDLAVIPPLDVSIAALSLGERGFGNWRAALRPDGGRLRFDRLEGHVGSVNVLGNGVWQERPAATELTLRLDGEDLGDLLAAWGNGRVIESDGAKGYAQLGWQDRPWNFALAKARGELSFELADGRVIDSGSASNVLRIFGILNLDSLARRLKLDFSDLWKSGLAFDRLAGHYRLDRGRASTLAPLRLEGPSANMTMTGVLDVVAETVDQDMEVTLPLTSNIPLAAILLGAPQVAGAVFLIDKLIGDKLEKVTTVRYHLSGDWDDPEVSIVRTAPPEGDVFPGDR